MTAAKGAAAAALAIEIEMRWPAFVASMPADRPLFEHVGVRLRAGDPVAAEIISFLKAAGAVDRGAR